MSKVVTPYPIQTIRTDWRPPVGARWWRLWLLPNDDGTLYTMQLETRCGQPLEQDLGNVIAVSWEFYDGENTLIDTGFDRITRARISGETQLALDVLHVDPPTPSPRWRPLTAVDCCEHPHDMKPKVISGHYLAEPL